MSYRNRTIMLIQKHGNMNTCMWTSADMRRYRQTHTSADTGKLHAQMQAHGTATTDIRIQTHTEYLRDQTRMRGHHFYEAMKELLCIVADRMHVRRVGLRVLARTFACSATGVKKE